MLNKKDGKEIRRFTREDLDKLIPNFGGKLEPPKDYTERKEENKVKLEKSQQEEAKDLLLKAIEYYKEDSPNKDCTLKIGNLGLHEELDKLSEKQLFEVQKILDFGHDPYIGKRLIISIPDHNKMNYTISQLNKRIPGFKDRIKLLKLENEQTEIEKQKSLLEAKIKKSQKKFKVKQLDTKAEIKAIKEAEDVKLQWNCPFCDFFCGGTNRGGLGSHVKNLHTEEEHLKYKAMTNEELVQK